MCQPVAFYVDGAYLIACNFCNCLIDCVANPYLYRRRYAPEKSPAKLTGKVEVAYEWSCTSPDINATYMHTMRCENAIHHAVPFPSQWKTAIPFLANVTKLLPAATKHASQKAENSIVTCKLLGIPVADERLDTLCGEESGSLVSLQGPNTELRQDFLLVAHVQEDTWICHPGSNANGLLCEVAPFDLEDLVAKDIRVEKIEDPQGRRRITKKHPARDLLNAAVSNPSAWSVARAYALWLAEEARADGRPFQLDRAHAGFESGPLRSGV